MPKPRPGVFRITKNIHNILQGVSHPDQRISAEEKQAIIDWITENANRYWFSEDGPLRAPEEGGADVVIVSRFFLSYLHDAAAPLTGHTLPPSFMHVPCVGCCTSWHLTSAAHTRRGGGNVPGLDDRLIRRHDSTC